MQSMTRCQLSSKGEAAIKCNFAECWLKAMFWPDLLSEASWTGWNSKNVNSLIKKLSTQDVKLSLDTVASALPGD
jgi:hypothetical protein